MENEEIKIVLESELKSGKPEEGQYCPYELEINGKYVICNCTSEECNRCACDI